MLSIAPIWEIAILYYILDLYTLYIYYLVLDEMRIIRYINVLFCTHVHSTSTRYKGMPSNKGESKEKRERSQLGSQSDFCAFLRVRVSRCVAIGEFFQI